MSRIKISLDKMNQKAFKKTWSVWIFGFGCIAFAVANLLIAGVFDRTLRLSELQLVSPEQQNITPYYNVTGEVLLHDQRILTARTAGTVNSIRVTPGAQVTAGTVLVTLVNPDIQEEVEQLEMELSVLRSELSLRTQRVEQSLESQKYEVELAEGTAEMEKARLESETTLHQMNVLSDIDFNLARLRFKQAEIELRRQQQELHLAEQELTIHHTSAENEVLRLESQLAFKKREVDELNIIAPVDLTVLDLDSRLSLGAAFEAGSPLLNYYKSGDLAIRVRVPPEMLPRLKIGQDAKFNVGNLNLSATVLRLGARIEGGSLPVWLEPSEPLENYVTEGQDIPVQLTLSPADATLRIPKPNWYRGPGRYNIYCYRHQELTPCEIELGYADDQHVEVFSELAPGTLLETTAARYWLGEIIREVQP